MFILVWTIILFLLKFRTVGCAAGGSGAIQVDALRRDGVTRRRRRNRILRNWRIRAVFCVASLAVPALSVCLYNHGADRFLASLADLDDLGSQLKSQAARGVETATQLLFLQDQLDILLQMDVLLTYCPNYASSQWANQSGFVPVIQQDLVSSWEETKSFVQEYTGDSMVESLQQVTRGTDMVQETIDWFFRHDWILTLFLVVLNIVIGFFLVGVFLTKNGIDCAAFQRVLSYVMLPLFCLVTVATVTLTCALAIFGSMNADLCSGGAAPGSPVGSLSDILLTSQQEDNSTALMYIRALDYYASVRSLAFVSDF
jgi:hypothetical protein